MFLRRGRTARRKPGQALVPTEAGRLPTIYLAETAKPKRELLPVYLCEAGQEEAGHRLKWLASTCLAGMVGVCLIGFAVYASMSMSDGKGMVSSIKQASLAALKPMRSATLARDGQSATVEKGDRIQLTASGFTSRNVIHETVVEHQGSREYITIKPYLRIVAGLATAPSDDADTLPPFNPFKLYTDSTPVGTDGDNAAADAPQAVSIHVADLANGVLPQDDGVELKPDEINALVNEAAENFAYADMPQGGAEVTGSLLQPAAYRSDSGSGPSPLAPNLTVIHKSAAEQDDDNDVDLDAAEDAETKTVKVGRGDTLAGIIVKVGAEHDQAKAIVEALRSSLPRRQPEARARGPLRPRAGAERHRRDGAGPRQRLWPAATSISAPSPAPTAATSWSPTRRARSPPKARSSSSAPRSIRASITQPLAQHIPADTILKLLRVHSYDVDFKQKVKPGDTFDVFFDVPSDDHDAHDAGNRDGDDHDGMGELLYTSMTVDGHTRSFWRFRTPDGVVDYYDEQGNSAKKFLMRNPVKGGRYTSGFGPRVHPLLGITRMHTGVDWAAPVGTPILAGADGTIERVGRQGGYGNYVRIRHTNGFSTAYGHMSRYADGLEPGMSVKQGQVIGYVGSTGFSTGPHCHYEILVNNKFVNPMTIQVPRGLQLTGRQLASFQKERNRIDELRALDPVTARVAQAAQ